MAKAKSAWSKFAEKEAQRDQERETTTTKVGPRKAGSIPTAQGDNKLTDAISRAEPMIEQIQNLYAQYFAGALKIPPIENRKQLQLLMDRIATEPKPTPAMQFRAQGIQAKFNTYRDRWDKLLLKLEKG